MLLDKQDSLNVKNEPYEPVETALIKFLLKPDDVALDIGAHIGYFTVLMAKHCALVHAFEPEPTNMELLRHNIKINNLENVLTYEKAVSEFNYSNEELYLCDSNSGMHRLYPSKWCNNSIKVPSIRLDIYEFSPDFIKMDIEGSELGALKGMKATIENHHPIMIMEFHPPSIEEYGASPRDEYDFLKSLGYSIRLIPKISIPISFEELDKETRKESGRNVLCISEGQKLF
jgi:FkbM family methyltransferase